MAAQESKLALAPRAPQAVTRHEAPDIFQVGQLLAQSGYFADAKDAAQAFVKVLAGRELGIGDIAAMTGIYIVKGKVSLSANLMAALVKRSGRYDYRVKRLDDKGCEIEFYDGGQPVGVSAFTEDDARKAQLSGDNWRKFPRNMYFARAMSNGVKFYCPDVSTAPIYTPDELGVPIDGESGEIATDEDIQEAKQLVRHNLEASGYPEGAAEYIAERAVEPQPRVLADHAEPEDGKALDERKARAKGLVSRGLVTRQDNGYSVGDGAIRDPHTYLVTRDSTGVIRCTCPDFAEMPTVKCVHILAVKEFIVAGQRQATEEEKASVSKLRERIYREFAKLEYSNEDIAEYMRRNEKLHGGTVLEVMSLAQLATVASGLEIND